jgi:hypothetical protein
VANAGTHEVRIGFFIGKSKNAKTPELDVDNIQPQEMEESPEKQ